MVARPTYKTIIELLSSIKVIATFNDGKLVRKFAYSTPIRLLQIVASIGFDPSIYLESFNVKMDIWDYSKSESS